MIIKRYLWGAKTLHTAISAIVNFRQQNSILKIAPKGQGQISSTARKIVRKSDK